MNGRGLNSTTIFYAEVIIRITMEIIIDIN